MDQSLQNDIEGKPLFPIHTELLLRKSPLDNDSKKNALKSKFVAFYESLFLGNDFSRQQPSFWDELFLLKVNISYLERCIELTNEEQLFALKDNINAIIANCCLMLSATNKVRVAHALETLCIFLKGILCKRFSNFAYDVLSILTGVERSDAVFKSMFEKIQIILIGEEIELKPLALHLLIIIATATENINQNRLIEFFMVNNVFDTLLKLMDDSFPLVSPTKWFRLNVLFLLCVLANYRQHETQNPYLMKWAELQSPKILKVYQRVITLCSVRNFLFIISNLIARPLKMFCILLALTILQIMKQLFRKLEFWDCYLLI